MFGKRQPRGGLAVRIAGVGVLLAAAFLMIASGASAASSVSLCVSSKQGVPVTSGGCPASTKNVTYTPVVLPSEPAAQQTLISILPYIKFAQAGVGGKPTIQVTGANLQIVSGSGKTNGPVNGAGNLIIGYGDEVECGIEALFNCGPAPRTGSHNLVLGTGQGYTSWGAILGGVANVSSAPGTFAVGLENRVTQTEASISGGLDNKASGFQASVSGGGGNKATSFRSSVSGGGGNEAAGATAWVGGGRQNTASGLDSSVAGGLENKAIGTNSAILGGFENQTTILASGSSVSGGVENTASENGSSVSGGKGNTASSRDSSVSGGWSNTASGEYSSVSGGKNNAASEELSSVSGGAENTASGYESSVTGGFRNTASGKRSAILGGQENLVQTELGHFP